MHNKVAKIVTIAALVIAIGGASEAARRHHRNVDAYAKGVALCDLDKDYYATHSKWCDSAEKEHLVTIHHRQTFPAVQSYEPSVTVMRDHQAADDGGHTSDRFIALQTAEDVARSPTVAYGVAGWFASAFDLGRKHPPIMTAEAPTRQAVTRTVATAARPISLTTNRAVTITIRPVTMAQQ